MTNSLSLHVVQLLMEQKAEVSGFWQVLGSKVLALPEPHPEHGVKSQVVQFCPCREDSAVGLHARCPQLLSANMTSENYMKKLKHTGGGPYRTSGTLLPSSLLPAISRRGGFAARGTWIVNHVLQTWIGRTSSPSDSMLDDVFQLGSFCNPYVKARKRVFVMWLVEGGRLWAVFVSQKLIRSTIVKKNRSEII